MNIYIYATVYNVVGSLFKKKDVVKTTQNRRQKYSRHDMTWHDMTWTSRVIAYIREIRVGNAYNNIYVIAN